MSWTINGEQRMRLQLSPLAMAVIEEDKLAFGVKSHSELLCRIFENHYVVSPASIGRTLTLREQELTALLQNPAAVRRMLDHEKQQLLCRRKYETVGGKQMIRLQNRTVATLLACEVIEEAYYRHPVDYLRAVVEDYCRLTAVERQRVYFAALFETMEAALHQNRLLQVVTQREDAYLVEPCVLQTDKLSSNYYLAGYSRPEGADAQERKAASFRVTALKSVTLLKAKMEDPHGLQRDMQERIVRQGIQFLLDDSCRIRVRLTENGVKKYHRLTSLRPVGKPIGDGVWEFDCTELQAQRYFLRMGADCEVLEPASLRERLAAELKAAAEKYA